jgi:methylisocitrate lyase
MPMSERVATFRRLHARGCFVLPNPWDPGSARALEQLGFAALATTSSGMAWTLGRADNRVPRDEVLAHLRAVVGAVRVPVTADFEGGFGTDPDAVAANVTLACSTGVAGLSIEDSTGDPGHPLHDADLAVARVRAARAAIDATGSGAVLTARTEGFVAGRPDLDETLRRLVAFAEAGADCLYAPGLGTRDSVAAVVGAVAPLPVNVLAIRSFASVAELAELGVRRVSVGGALARAAWTGFLRAADDLTQHGSLPWLDGLVGGDELDGRFGSGEAR